MSDVALDGEGNKFMAVVDGTSWVGFAVVANVVTARKTKLSFFIQKKVQFFLKDRTSNPQILPQTAKVLCFHYSEIDISFDIQHFLRFIHNWQ